MTKVAIMQPYFFPYWGYFQLIACVDKFVIFDDVNYIKKGWINRNRILQHSDTISINLPIHKASQNRKINQHLRSVNNQALEKLKKKISFAYCKSENFTEVYPLIFRLIDNPETNVAKFLAYSLSEISAYIGLTTDFIYSSELSNHDDYDNAQQRIIALTKQVNGTQYWNLPGGKMLYDADQFKRNDIGLKFITVELPEYQQYLNTEFQAGLSIIDVLMHMPKKDILNALSTP
jgi:hypothetical protein